MKQLLLFLTLISLNLGIAQDFWTEVAPFDNAIYFPKQISIVDENVVWVNGVTNDISNPNKWSKSIDGGLTWVSGEYNIPNSIIGSLHSISNNVAFATSILTDYNNPNPTGINGVWKTTDGGLTWVHQTTATFNNTDSFVNTIHFWNENHGIVLGDPVNNSFEIFTTQDGGTNWTQVPAANIPISMTNEVGYVLNFEAKGNTIWFGTNAGRIFKSTNQGQNWTVNQSPIQDFGGNDSGSFAFKNENEGLLIDSQWQQWRTLDGGVSWIQEFPIGNVKNFHTVFIPETNNAYFQYGEDITSSRGSSLSTNGGQEWINLDSFPNSVEPSVVKFKNNNVGFCFGTYTGFISPQKKFFRLNGTNALLKTENFNKNKISVSPNPVKDFIRIYGNKISTIEIFDVTGKVVVLENFIPSNEISLNLENLQNGMYLAKVKSETDSVSTIKIIKE